MLTVLTVLTERGGPQAGPETRPLPVSLLVDIYSFMNFSRF